MNQQQTLRRVSSQPRGIEHHPQMFNPAERSLIAKGLLSYDPTRKNLKVTKTGRKALDTDNFETVVESLLDYPWSEEARYQGDSTEDMAHILLLDSARNEVAALLVENVLGDVTVYWSTPSSDRIVAYHPFFCDFDMLKWREWNRQIC